MIAPVDPGITTGSSPVSSRPEPEHWQSLHPDLERYANYVAPPQARVSPPHPIPSIKKKPAPPPPVKTPPTPPKKAPLKLPLDTPQ